jgi:hypothetical protein
MRGRGFLRPDGCAWVECESRHQVRPSQFLDRGCSGLSWKLRPGRLVFPAQNETQDLRVHALFSGLWKQFALSLSSSHIKKLRGVRSHFNLHELGKGKDMRCPVPIQRQRITKHQWVATDQEITAVTAKTNKGLFQLFMEVHSKTNVGNVTRFNVYGE